MPPAFLIHATDQIDLAPFAVTQAQPANEHLYRQRMRVEHRAANTAGVRAAYAELELLLR
jgi:hypothetical protein